MAQRATLSRSERDAVLRESGYRCGVPTCNTTIALDVHHIIQISEGGGNDPLNLFAVCPTCHALYHRGIISHESIKTWKARLIAINSAADVRVENESRADRLQQDEVHKPPDHDKRSGFSAAAAEFYWRTCELGFRYEHSMFVTTGFCCFVAPGVAITSSEAVSMATEIAALRDGIPSIRTMLGLAPFEIVEPAKTGNLTAIRLGVIDDSHVKELLARHNDPQLSQFFAAPLQTRCKFRIVPFVGERVAFLHSSTSTEQHRITAELQFDSADVSFAFAAKGKPDDVFQWVLSPVMSRVQHRGSPVFTANAQLVGIIRDTLLLDGESAWRPVVAAAVEFHELFTGQPAA